MNDVWRRRIDRASALAGADERVAALLTQYAAILAAQAVCHAALAGRLERLRGSIDQDLAQLRPHAVDLWRAIAAVAPAEVMRNAPTDTVEIDALLTDGWRVSDVPFLARVVLQPYAEALSVHAGSHHRPAHTVRHDRGLQPKPGRAMCPFCGGPPQVSVIRSDNSMDGGGRALVCATCATAWPLRRILCVYCGEEEERRLTYFHAPEFDHIRVDTCATCRHYIKTVDLTRLGLAVPLVDDVASGALDIWAREGGYTKVTPNLIGL